MSGRLNSGSFQSSNVLPNSGVNENRCRRPIGGDISAKSPRFLLNVSNPDGQVWQFAIATEELLTVVDDIQDVLVL